MLVINATDEGSEEDVKFLFAVSHDGTSHCPNQREQEQALQPQGDLKEKTTTMQSIIC
jgi:hypothetical protein